MKRLIVDFAVCCFQTPLTRHTGICSWLAVTHRLVWRWQASIETQHMTIMYHTQHTTCRYLHTYFYRYYIYIHTHTYMYPKMYRRYITYMYIWYTHGCSSFLMSKTKHVPGEGAAAAMGHRDLLQVEWMVPLYRGNGWPSFRSWSIWKLFHVRFPWTFELYKKIWNVQNK